MVQLKPGDNSMKTFMYVFQFHNGTIKTSERNHLYFDIHRDFNSIMVQLKHKFVLLRYRPCSSISIP